MTKAISMAIELDQDIMITNMCVKFGEGWTNSFQELDRKQSSGRTYRQGQPYIPTLCGGIKTTTLFRGIIMGSVFGLVR